MSRLYSRGRARTCGRGDRSGGDARDIGIPAGSFGAERGVIRVANGQGFWGDWVEAPMRLLRDGPIDYLTLDYLAEVTMAVLQKQRMKRPAGGYAHDFPPLVQRLAPDLTERGVALVANAGGLNPEGC